MPAPPPTESTFIPRREFLGWDRPLLEAAVDALAAGWSSGVLDLSDRMLVVPTRQSGRRLREALAERAATRNAGVFPPRVLTTEAMLIDVRPPGRPVATAVESMMTWAAVLGEAKLDEFPALFPQRPLRPDFAWALKIGKSWQQVRRTLGEAGWSMGAVARRLAADGHVEAARWADLARLEEAYLERLAEGGRDDAQLARFAAADAPVLPAGISRIDWVAVTDPPEVAVRAAARLGEQGVAVTVWIAAPGDRGDSFDAWGRPDPEVWCGARDLPLPLERIHLAAGPVEQAETVRALAAGHAQPAGTLGLGVADVEVADALATAKGEEAGEAAHGRFPCHRPDGEPARDHELWHVLSGWARVLNERSFRALGQWLRSPAAAACLRRRGGLDHSLSQAWLLEAWDAYVEAHLPHSLADGRAFDAAIVNTLTAAAESTAKEFAGRPLPEAVGALLAEVYERRRFSAVLPRTASFVALARELSEVTRQAADAAGRAGVSPAAGELLDVVLDVLRDVRLEMNDRPAEAVDINGWLEVSWDPAPHLIVAGLNDGVLPEVIIGDAYVPESLRTRLGMRRTNAARLARDAYQLHALLESRAATGGRVDVVLGRTTALGEALRPSRLLFMRPDDELPARVDALFRDGRLPPPPAPPAWSRRWRLKAPEPKRFERIRVTAFRDYLACPFRFYLRHGLRMEEVDPDPRELDARGFGVLCHAALKALATDPAMQECGDAREVAAFLREQVRRELRATHGEDLSVPLRVQLRSAERRLASLAVWHAESVRDGWVTVGTEVDIADLLGSPFRIDGMEISGRIDRIDARGGERRIIDYKTSDSRRPAEEVHWGKSLGKKKGGTGEWPEWQRVHIGNGKIRAWCDLQLPLYVLAARQAWGSAPEVGYCHLAKAAVDCRYEPWSGLTDEVLEQSDACARAVIAAIHDRRFWPPGDGGRFDDFAWMLPGGAEEAVDPSALMPS